MHQLIDKNCTFAQKIMTFLLFKNDEEGSY